MDYSFVFQILVLVIVLINIILLIIFRAARRSGSQEQAAQTQVLQKFDEYEKRLDKSELSLRDEFGRNRD